jgi:hypothetical protein
MVLGPGMVGKKLDLGHRLNLPFRNSRLVFGPPKAKIPASGIQLSIGILLKPPHQYVKYDILKFPSGNIR